MLYTVESTLYQYHCRVEGKVYQYCAPYFDGNWELKGTKTEKDPELIGLPFTAEISGRSLPLVFQQPAKLCKLIVFNPISLPLLPSI